MRIIYLILLSILLTACNKPIPTSSIDPINWEKRMVQAALPDSLEAGETYLSVYSQVYSQSENHITNLAATISMRNTSTQDSIFILKAEFFDTHGKSIRSYFAKPIFLAPMETVEIVIDQHNDEGGTGGNFIFDWEMKPGTSEPLFEGVMISTLGHQGLSFTTQGKRTR